MSKRRPTYEELTKDKMVILEHADTDSRDGLEVPPLTRWEFPTEAECYAAVRVLNWIQSGSSLMFGFMTMPELEDDTWIVYLGFGPG
jgi:hypothetical protein